ncbi:hypothetical protein OSB04_026266 [Centaurea solstitialis]|uniref:DYW domain-containing protein n=1 Tax=Centaurea solstitialis TaxID=347529 RepID=A0AA38SBL0_9ASTR|nr:hypothetical protein OSB04_026266 [Centaurea solstitialis]
MLSVSSSLLTPRQHLLRLWELGGCCQNPKSMRFRQAKKDQGISWVLDTGPNNFFMGTSEQYASLIQRNLAVNKDPCVGKAIHARIIKSALHLGVFLMNTLMNFYAKTGFLDDARKLFDEMPVRDPCSWNTVIYAYAKKGKVDHARRLFVEMPEPDIVSWNSMMVGYTQIGCFEKAIKMFIDMISSKVIPTQYTFNIVLASCAAMKSLDIGQKVHSFVVELGLGSHSRVADSLLNMYAKSGDLLMAKTVFGRMKLKSTVSWNTLLAMHMQNGFNEEAIDLFRSMIKGGPEPDIYTLSAMLSVSSRVASLDHGKQIHARAIKSEALHSVTLSNALIDMYAKCGNISNAQRVFEPISCLKDTILWTTMVVSLARHGHGEESLELFEKMLSLDINPNHITYVGVISACTHMGLVEEGRGYFKSMQEKHGIEPNTVHYACMIDLLGRAGKLQEAWDVIQNMPIEPNVMAWKSLLASSFIHKNMELAKVAAEKALLIEPDDSGTYMALANVYSACGNWEYAAEIRRSMRFRQVKKDQGFSWVQIRDRVHVFGAEDDVHPEREEIYRTMAEIWKEIKKLGFVPKTEVVLHDVDEEMKEQVLMHHSEKLAIAYALMKTPKNGTLRIMKNLRMCKDCHSAIKFISKLVGREIVVRDWTRFHHFKDGVCSCRDYW